jgi:hypothetical protein
LAQNPLESPDGTSYYTLYPLRPGTTTFEVEYVLPYHDRKYTFRKRVYEDISFFQIGLIPRDLVVAGEGLTLVHENEERNFAVYSGGPIRAGAEITWTFSGGTPMAASSGESDRVSVRPMPTSVGRNALLIGPLALMTLVLVLWYAMNRTAAAGSDPRMKALRERRELLLSYIASLDDRYERQALDHSEYLPQRERARRQLRRVMALLGKR